MGLIYGNKETLSYLTFDRLDCPTGVQLFGNSAENIAKSALICLKMNPCVMVLMNLKNGYPLQKN